MAVFKDFLKKKKIYIYIKHIGNDTANNWDKLIHYLWDKAFHHCSKLKENTALWHKRAKPQSIFSPVTLAGNFQRFLNLAKLPNSRAKRPIFNFSRAKGRHVTHRRLMLRARLKEEREQSSLQILPVTKIETGQGKGILKRTKCNKTEWKCCGSAENPLLDDKSPFLSSLSCRLNITCWLPW